MNTPSLTLTSSGIARPAPEDEVDALLARMTLEEKIGQLQQVDASADPLPEDLLEGVRRGRIGSVINLANTEACNRLQRVAIEDSRLGIPLLMGRDVIHGFRTIFPIPLGQAAAWNQDLVRKAARISALEARSQGVHWTFSPMIDISRDPRWGRIAESFGEDPYLTGLFGCAMVEGYQTDNLSGHGAVLACAKHFVGYGASESGRDYNTTNIPPNELRNIYLEPFRKVLGAGAATLMTSFSDLDGIPATANGALLNGVLRREWGFDGLVVSDWNAINELIQHGLCEDSRSAAAEAALAGVDMEMAGDAYARSLADLIDTGVVPISLIDTMVRRILRLKQKLNLFQCPYTEAAAFAPLVSDAALDVAYQIAVESIVLLKNDGPVLPLQGADLGAVAVIGPLADAPHEQMGTWVFDGQMNDTVTPLQALRQTFLGKIDIHYAPGLETSRSRSHALFEAAEAAVLKSDVALVFLGEESILSGEAHSRADIRLPGAQSELLARLKALGKPVVTVVLAGRPLVLTADLPHTDALVYAWHPGTMGGPAILDVLLGAQVPRGKLPVTFPKSVGQVPIYYNHKNTGRPPVASDMVLIDDIEVGARQTSLGMSAFHLDDGFEPLFPFGFGLSYGQFELGDLDLSQAAIGLDERLKVRASVRNTGAHAGSETVQLYIRDLAGSLTRPVRELKAFRRVGLEPGQSTSIEFEIGAQDLSFYRRDGSFGPEPGRFSLWVATSSAGGLEAAFSLTA
jgi:beta-glucosidase